MSARTFTTILSLAAVPFFACGGDSKTVDAGLVLHDTGSNGSNGSNGSAACAVMSSYNITFDMNNSVEVNAGSDLMSKGFSQHNVFVGALGSAQTDPQIQVDIIGGAGTTKSPDWPTNLGPKSGIDVPTAQQTDVQVAIYVNGQNLPAYLATAGTMNITAASNTTGSNFAGNITGLTLTHVDISGTMASPDPDGCTTTFANLMWSGMMKAPMPFDGKTPVTLHPALFHRYQ